MNKKGFTLIELIISMAILGILIVAFMTVFNFSYINLINSGNRTDAAYDANSITDSLFSKNFSNATAIRTFLNGLNVVNGKSYYDSGVASVTDYENKDINYKVFNESDVLGVKGSMVEIAVFYNSGNDYVQFTVFVPYGG